MARNIELRLTKQKKFFNRGFRLFLDQGEQLKSIKKDYDLKSVQVVVRLMVDFCADNDSFHKYIMSKLR